MNKIDENIHVLIPDGENKLALSVVVCLSKHKQIKTHIISKFDWVEMRFSKNIASFNVCPKEISDQEWMDYVKMILKKYEISVLFPVFIEKIRLLSIFKQEFINLVSHLILPESDSFDIFNDKWKLYEFLKENQINSPLTFHLKFVSDKTYEWVKYPVLLKPLSKMGGHGIIKVNNKKDLINAINNDLIIQEFVQGFDIDMSVLCKNGEILAYTIQKGYIFSENPYSPAFGIEFLYHKELFELVSKLMNKIKWTGFAHLDLRYDTIDNKFKIIEINPRIWGSIEASSKVGINFPYLYCLTSLGNKYEIPAYRFEKYANRTGIVKIIKSKWTKPNGTIKLEFPENTSIDSYMADPAPKLYKLLVRNLKKIMPSKSKFMDKFKYEVF